MKSHILMQVAVLGLLAGCGGGGGGGGNNNNGGPITAQNAPVVASAAQSAIDDSSSGGAVGTDFFVASVSGGPAKDFSLAELAIDQVVRFRSKSQSAGLVTPAATVGCTDGGSVTDVFSNNDTNPEFTAGDTLSLTFDNCVEGGIFIDGRLTLALTSLTGDPAGFASDYSLTIAIMFNNFVVNGDGQSSEIDGSLTVSASRSGNTETVTVSSSSLTFRDTGIPSNPVRVLSGFSVTEIYNDTTGSYTISVTGTLNDSRVGFNVMATTITPLASDGFSNPTSGSIRLTAGDGTSVTLTATGGDTVRLDVDTNGDGTIDSIINTSWTALDALS